MSSDCIHRILDVLSVPEDVTPPMAESFHRELDEGLRPLDDSQSLQDSIGHHVTLLGRVIKRDRRC